MKRARPVVVTKRDGTRECFSVPKLRNALVKVLRACGREPYPADPLAQAVALHLRGWTGKAFPTTGYVHRCACTALMQLGIHEAAEELDMHRRQRAARRRGLRVFDPRRPERITSLWRKGALVATLKTRYQLRQPVARLLAGRIEEQVFALGYRLVSKTLLSELLQNEIMAWGLLDAPVGGVWSDQVCPGPLVGGALGEEM